LVMPSSGRSPRRLLASLSGLAVAATGLSFAPLPAHAAPDGSGLVISEVYGAGGNNGAVYNADFVELYNPTDRAISVAGMSIQYRSANGNPGSSPAPLSGTVPASSYYLIQMSAAGTTGAALANPDAAPAKFNMAAGGGQVILASTTSAIATQGDLAGAPNVVDMVGASGSTSFETSATSASATATQSLNRAASGGDTDVNSADFRLAAPSPQGSGSAGGPEPDPEPEPEPTSTTIAEIQGTGMTSTMVGRTVTTRGVVTAVPERLFGFYLQTAGSGATAGAASEGIFVYYPQGSGEITVEPGDHVEVTGQVAEHAGQTQIRSGAASTQVLTEPAAPPVAYAGDWPATPKAKEALEGMLFSADDYEFTVSDTYSTNQFGEVGLALGDRPLIQPTEVADAQDLAAIAAVEADNAARAITLDDGSSTDFSRNPTLTPAYVSTTAPVRVGAAADFTGDVIITEGGAPDSPSYRFQPVRSVDAARDYTATAQVVFENTRTNAPDEALLSADGTPDVKVAAFNVLNYFTTLGASTRGCQSYTHASGEQNNVRTGCDPRGAWDAQDLERQQEKIVAAINALDADVVGLMEIENSARLGETPDEATQTLVDALNADAGAGTWAVNPSSSELPPAQDQDVITNALIYKPAAVERVGEARALDAKDGAFSNAREPIGQVFEPVDGGEEFLYVVNHFKSKGSGADDGTGQGNANPDRVAQAEALVEWVGGVQIETGVDAVLLGGDFNAYTMEDPMQVLYEEGYEDVVSAAGTGEFSYSFSGLSGSLDHIVANAAAMEHFTGADIWNINAPESIALEYSRFGYHGSDFHEPGPYRSSDHDPVIVGLDLVDEPTVPGPTDPGPTNPGPTDPPTPGPTDPTDPEPTDPEPTDPEPTDPTEPPAVEPVTPEIRSFWYPKNVVAGKTRATLTVKVFADGEAADGWVRVSFPGKKTKVVKLEDGVLKVRLWKFGGAGDKALTITYNGRGDVAPRTIERVVTVVKK
ncbi:ExeM/NucH family extracellular endonuclease, partial [Nocardioides sp. IC4_145]|uniref:ExeM/NucH family extracellular endonuclease n=1 Tax=Nocardioides sp. IC4_145 TaxID=2714037 RepID=UPI00140791F3